MTGDLRDALQRRAAALHVPDFDVAELVARGERRVRRRRIGTAVGAGVLAFAVAAGTVLLIDPDGVRRADPVRPSPSESRTTGPDAGATRPVVWAVEAGRDARRTPAQVHVGDRKVRVEAVVGGLQATDDGVAYVTGGGNRFRTLWFTDGRSVTRLGRTGDSGIRGDELLKSAVAGSLLAWVEYPPSPPAQVVLYDTHRMAEVARTPLQVPWCDATWPPPHRSPCVSMFAVRGERVYIGQWEGNFDGITTTTLPLVVVDVVTGERRTISYAEYEAELRGAARGLVVGDSLDSGLATPGVGEFLVVDHGRLVKQRLTPDGQAPRAVSVFDSATGRAVRAFELPEGYRHEGSFIISQWVDDDGFVAWAHDSADTHQGALLLCRLSTARCELAVPPPDGSRYQIQIAPESTLA